MMIMVLDFVLMLIELVLAALFINLILAPRLKLFYTASIYVAGMLISYVIFYISSAHHLMKPIIFIVMSFIFVFLLFKGLLKQKLLAGLLLVIINIAAELAATLIFMPSLGYDMPDVTKMGPEKNLVNVIYVTIVSLIYLLVSVLWHKKKNSQVRLQDFFAFAIFPLSQLLLIEGTFSAYNEGDKLYIMVYTIMGIALAALANIYMLKIIKQLIRKAELEKKILQLEQHQRLSYDHLMDIEMLDRHHRMFHHDINNQLSVIMILLETNKHAQAYDMLNALSDNIRHCGREKYCSHPVVNAVLVQKSVVARDHGIKVDIDVYVHENSSIAAIDLCSVFSNLIDNAIEAAFDPSDSPQPRFIDIKAGIKQEYLIIKITNSKSSKSGEKGINKDKYLSELHLHGLGLSIIEDISKKYEGSFTVNNLEDSFTATVLLKDRQPVTAD